MINSYVLVNYFFGSRSYLTENLELQRLVTTTYCRKGTSVFMWSVRNKYFRF